MEVQTSRTALASGDDDDIVLSEVSSSTSSESAEGGMKIELDPMHNAEAGTKRKTGLCVPSCATAERSAEYRLKQTLVTLLLLAIAPTIAIGAALAAGYFVFNWTEVGVAFAYVVISELVRRSLWRVLRNVYCRRILGLTSDEILDLNGPREHLSKTWLSDLLADPRRRRNIKICDVLFRKGGHVVSLMSSVVVGDFLTKDIGSLLFANSLGCILLTTVMVVLTWTYRDPKHKHKWQGFSLLWGATDRIRDGKYAQQNSMLASISLLWGVTVAYFACMAALPSEDEAEVLWSFALSVVLLPLTFGDALGEIIGTPLGRHKFKVRGLGEINQKSIEGCVAVFLGSLIPLLVVAATMAPDKGAILPGTWGLIAAVAVLSTFTETVAFRSTDNMVIPLCNAVLFVVWYSVGGVLEAPRNLNGTAI